MANNGTSGVGRSNGGGPLSTGGPMGGPGRPGKRVDAAQTDSGDYTGPGVPSDPFRQNSSQGFRGVRKTNPLARDAAGNEKD